jgi:class 3 adenylate cyclase
MVLADISGYTAFLEDVRAAHADDAFAGGQIPDAYALMSSLLDGIATAIDPPFTLVKFEGDAVFAVASDDEVPTGDDLVACIVGCYEEFRRRRQQAGLTWTCTCTACAVKDSLDLKFVLHLGAFIVQSIGVHTDVLGPDVTVAHRLMKNSAATRLGSSAYALFTEEAVAGFKLDLRAAQRFTESVEGAGDVGVVAIPLNGG